MGMTANQLSLVRYVAENNLQKANSAVKRRFTEKHEMFRFKAEENEEFIRQFLDDAGFFYDTDSLKAYAAKCNSQAEIMTHMTRCIADAMIDDKAYVVL